MSISYGELYRRIPSDGGRGRVMWTVRALEFGRRRIVRRCGSYLVASAYARVMGAWVYSPLGTRVYLAQ